MRANYISYVELILVQRSIIKQEQWFPKADKYYRVPLILATDCCDVLNVFISEENVESYIGNVDMFSGGRMCQVEKPEKVELLTNLCPNCGQCFWTWLVNPSFLLIVQDYNLYFVK